jgi:peroxiredoxin
MRMYGWIQLGVTGETRPMRRRLLAGGALLGLLAGGKAVAGNAPAAPAPLAWPTVELLDGGRFGAEQARGHDVVLVFWSTTCPFCRRHNQHVEKLHRAAKAQGSALRVLGVARDRDPEVVRRYAQAQGYTFPITMAAAPLMELVGARRVIPLTAVVDKTGRLRQAIPGEMFEEDVMELLEGPR